MDYRILFTQSALTNFAQIIGYIAEDDSEAAMFFGEALLDHVELLTCFPQMGGPIRDRSRVGRLLHSPVLEYYRLRADRRLIEILNIRHITRKPLRF
jgi:plasmid stabilization system protein ParE